MQEKLEKEFMQQHRYRTKRQTICPIARNRVDECYRIRQLRNRSTPSHMSGQLQPRGVKRGQADSWEEGRTRNKHQHVEEFRATPHYYHSQSNGTVPGPFS